MTSQLMEESMRSNNEGVAHAASNHVNQAADEFCKSLRIAQHLLSGVSPEYNDLQSPSTDPMHLPTDMGNERYHHYHTTKTVRFVKSGPSGVFVYQKALILESTSSASMTSETLANRLSTYCAATCYNLALLYHQEGLSTGRSRCIDKAEQLYSACLRLLQNGNLSCLNPTTLLITIIASNNLAEIELSKGMVQTASSHIQFVEWLVYECQVVKLDLFSPEEIHDLMGNMLHGKGMNTATAA
ncbi:unnamed protein product [Cylindrotheca closterium]|uniref:Uncharacterized protein n=1 Tax=Cylindrotheca closterium TaxID=2856 RepID=A0AAD2PVY0_9STRA|nr:unnamed protein product [Cylindrotheca closterium]